MFLFLSTSFFPISYFNQVGIVINIVRGLEYLHEHSHPPVVHRDIKSSNILLDSNFNAKVRSICDSLKLEFTHIFVLWHIFEDVYPFNEIFLIQLSDFGLAVTSGTESNNLKLSGTMDYVAPEYLLDGMLDFTKLSTHVLLSFGLYYLYVCFIFP